MKVKGIGNWNSVAGNRSEFRRIVLEQNEELEK
jgi:hypothetical protein